MPTPLAPLFAFAIGVFLAWRSRAETNAHPSVWNPQVAAVALYASLVFAPATGYFAVFATDWSFAYLVDGRLVPSALSLTIILLGVLALVGGFVAGRHALERHAPSELAWLAGCPLAIVLLVVAALYDRLGVAATYDQFVSNFGREPLFTSRLGLALLWMDGIVAAGAVLTLRWLAPNQPPGQTAPAPVPAAPVVSIAQEDGPKRFLGHGRPPR